jgi:hypothetical protein
VSCRQTPDGVPKTPHHDGKGIRLIGSCHRLDAGDLGCAGPAHESCTVPTLRSPNSLRDRLVTRPSAVRQCYPRTKNLFLPNNRNEASCSP